MSNSNEPKRVIAWGRIFFVAIIVVILANFGKISSFFGSVFAPVIYDEIDPFSDMLVEVSGTEPFLTLEYTDISGDPFLMENVKYEADKTDGLSNGDVVTITATASKTALKAAKKVFSRTTMQYTVEGQPFYITPDTELTDEQLASLQSNMQDLIQTMLMDNGADIQHEVQSYLFDDSWKYGFMSDDPIVTVSDFKNVELVVLPIESSYNIANGRAHLLTEMTITFDPNNNRDAPQTFTACLSTQFHTIEMQGNDITSWDLQYKKFYDNVHDGVIVLKKEDPTCKEIPLPAAQ